MTANQDTSVHKFDVALAVAVGIEKAILLGNIVFWITENERNGKKSHFQDGQYWTYDSAKNLAVKYPYFKEKSISRWLNELEADGWIKRSRFNANILNKTTWFALGERLVQWRLAPIPQNEECISQNEISIPQNETSISQNEECIPQNEESIYKDTDIKPTDVKPFLNADSRARDERAGNVPAVEAKIIPFTSLTGREPMTGTFGGSLTITADQFHGTPAGVLLPSSTPSSARPPSSPVVSPPPPALPVHKPIPIPAGKTYGNGQLQADCIHYYQLYPDQFPLSIYLPFIRWWTQKYQKGDIDRIGMERWLAMDKWDLETRLDSWHQRELKNDQSNGNLNSTTAHFLNRQRAAEPQTVDDYGDF